MKTGNSHVSFPSQMKNVSMKTLDANSSAAGTFTEARQVGNKTAYLTEAGAALFDAQASEALYAPIMEKDPGFFKRFFFGGVTEDANSIGEQ